LPIGGLPDFYNPTNLDLRGGTAVDIASWSPRMLSVLRIMTGLLFLEHGTQKLFAFPPPTNPGPALLSLLGVQGVIELVGGILILIGLFTRPVAFILAGDMAVAYFYAHAPRGFFPQLNGGKLAILYCFVFLYLSMAGGGAWSVDQQRASSRSR
jgi:putative oxidoreductase